MAWRRHRRPAGDFRNRGVLYTAMLDGAFWLVGPFLLRKGSLTYTQPLSLVPPLAARNEQNKEREERYEAANARREGPTRPRRHTPAGPRTRP